jgi:transposase
MLRWEDMIEIKILAKQGYSIRRIAKRLKISRNAVRRYLKASAEKPCYGPRPPVSKKLDAFIPYVLERRTAAVPDKIPATVLFQEITHRGYIGSISLLREFLRQQNDHPEQPTLRFETPPGKQMQVDWASFRRGPSRLSAFIAILGYSRMAYVEFVENEQIDTLLQCLLHTFEYFGGVTEELLFDNMKTVVLQRHAYAQGQHRFHQQLWDFAKHYGFVPKLCQPYRPQTKGKVERFISYLRQSFYIPLRATLAQADMLVDVQTANKEVASWLVNIANTRLHATLQQRPFDLFAAEKDKLLPLAPTYRGVPINIAPPPDTLAFEPIKVAWPVNILQHDLDIYQCLLEKPLS